MINIANWDRSAPTITTDPGQCNDIYCRCNTVSHLCNTGPVPLTYSNGAIADFIRSSFEDCSGFYNYDSDHSLVAFAPFQIWRVRLLIFFFFPSSSTFCAFWKKSIPPAVACADELSWFYRRALMFSSRGRMMVRVIMRAKGVRRGVAWRGVQWVSEKRITWCKGSGRWHFVRGFR